MALLKNSNYNFSHCFNEVSSPDPGWASNNGSTIASGASSTPSTTTTTTSSFETTTVNASMARALAELSESYDHLMSFLDNNSLTLSDIGSVCQPYYDMCSFSDAELCISEQRILWHAFIGYLPPAVLLVSIALLFNVLSILFVSRVRHKLPRHKLLQNMSVSDFSLSLFTVIKRSADYLPDGSAKHLLLLYGNMIWQALWLISAFGILFLAFDCFFATRFPFLYDKRSTRIAVLIAAVCLWLGAFLFTGLLLVFELSYSSIIQYVICLLMVLILLAIVAQSIYAFTLTERMRRQQLVMTLRDDKTIKNARKSRLKSSSTIAIIMTSSFISWLPLVIYFAVDESVHAANVQLSQPFLAICLVCFHMNAVINPIIYSLRFKDVRTPMRRHFAQHVLLKPFAKIWKDDDDDNAVSAIGNSNYVLSNAGGNAAYIGNKRRTTTLSQSSATGTATVNSYAENSNNNNFNNNNGGSLLMQKRIAGYSESEAFASVPITANLSNNNNNNGAVNNNRMVTADAAKQSNGYNTNTNINYIDNNNNNIGDGNDDVFTSAANQDDKTNQQSNNFSLTANGDRQQLLLSQSIQSTRNNNYCNGSSKVQQQLNNRSICEVDELAGKNCSNNNDDDDADGSIAKINNDSEGPLLLSSSSLTTTAATAVTVPLLSR